jgi:hypothetical protein
MQSDGTYIQRNPSAKNEEVTVFDHLISNAQKRLAAGRQALTKKKSKKRLNAIRK